MEDLAKIGTTLGELFDTQGKVVDGLLEVASQRTEDMLGQMDEATAGSSHAELLKIREELGAIAQELGEVAATLAGVRSDSGRLVEEWIGAGGSASEVVVPSPSRRARAAYINPDTASATPDRRTGAADVSGGGSAADVTELARRARAAAKPSPAGAGSTAAPGTGSVQSGRDHRRSTVGDTRTKPDFRTEYVGDKDGPVMPPAAKSEGWNGPEGDISNAQLDAVFSAAIANGGLIPESVRLSKRDAALLNGALAIVRRNIYRTQHPGRAYDDKTMPKEMPSMKEIAESLEEGETAMGLLLAAEALEGKPRKRGAAVTMARKGGNRLKGTIFAPDIVVDALGGRSEQRLRSITNGLIERDFGSKYRRNNGPSATPMLIGQAMALLGKEEEVDSDVAAAMAEGFRRSWEHTRKVDGGFPEDITELAKDMDTAWRRGFITASRRSRANRITRRRLFKPRDDGVDPTPILDELSGVTGRHAERTRMLAEKRRQKKLEGKDKAAKQAEKRRERAEHIKSTSRDYAAATTLSVTQLSARARRAMADKDVDGLANALMLLNERRSAGSRTAGAEFSRLWARTSGPLIEEAHKRLAEIDSGKVSPGLADFIQHIGVGADTDASMYTKITELKDALERSAFNGMGMKLVVKSPGKEGKTIEEYHPALYNNRTRHAITEGWIYRLKQRGMSDAAASSYGSVLAALERQRANRLLNATKDVPRIALPRLVEHDVIAARRWQAATARARRTAGVRNTLRSVTRKTRTSFKRAAAST